ncbi:uncharacterized protein LOC130053489 [Ostrea edulis]|uniref:uncharacterized protein LOC130053488 n=1 Tax=Ostrea edulis TaxID=37623 RepID=UPI0024AE8B5F|nr:uncharacterized protein LOC130053488 [Ostrea edulis]XP_056016779.1 uncharacterized protein LOC130053489 [Ostrea edulis]
MSDEEISEVGIVKVHRQGDPKAKRSFPRPAFVQFQDIYQKEKIMKNIPKLKIKGVSIRISNHYPEKMREKRKRLYDLQNSYRERIFLQRSKVTSWSSTIMDQCTVKIIGRPKAFDILEDPSDNNASKIHQVNK